MLDNLLISSLVGAALGAGAGYFFSHMKKRRKKT